MNKSFIFIISLLLLILNIGCEQEKEGQFLKENITIDEAVQLVDFTVKEPEYFPIDIKEKYATVDILYFDDDRTDQQTITIYYKDNSNHEVSYSIHDYKPHYMSTYSETIHINETKELYYFRNKFTQTIMWEENNLYYRLNYAIGDGQENIDKQELVNIFLSIK